MANWALLIMNCLLLIRLTAYWLWLDSWSICYLALIGKVQSYQYVSPIMNTYTEYNIWKYIAFKNRCIGFYYLLFKNNNPRKEKEYWSHIFKKLLYIAKFSKEMLLDLIKENSHTIIEKLKFSFFAYYLLGISKIITNQNSRKFFQKSNFQFSPPFGKNVTK